MILASLASRLVPLLRLVDEETAHALALRGLRAGLAGIQAKPDPGRLAVRAMCRSCAAVPTNFSTVATASPAAARALSITTPGRARL